MLLLIEVLTMGMTFITGYCLLEFTIDEMRLQKFKKHDDQVETN